jgi:hypothetical protein
MRGLRGRRGLTAAFAVAAAVLVLGVSTAVVVAFTTHRPPPAVPVGTQPANSTGAVAAGHVVPDTTPSAAATTRPAPRTVRIDETGGPLTVPVGTRIDVELRGDPTDRWAEPKSQAPNLLERLSGSATPDGNARGLFEALAAGQAFILVERSTTCSSGPTGGVCGVQARRISVTITAQVP